MSNKQEYNVLTPQQRASLANAREAEAQLRKRNAAARSAVSAPMATVQRPKTVNSNTREYPRIQNSTLAAPQNRQQRVKSQRPSAHTNAHQHEKEDTGEFPSYVRAGKRGGYRPQTKKRHVARQHRRKLDPKFKAILSALCAVALVVIILLICGVRYSTEKLDDGSKIRFFGIAKDGEANNGWLSYSTGERGKLKNGNIIEYSDGSVYEGELIDNIRSGFGKLTYANGDEYTGMFVNDKKNGQGTIVYKNGDKYEGNFIDGKRSGNGLLTYADGSTYNGNFENDRKNGYGVMTSVGDSEYKGNFTDDIKNGEGEQIFANGDRYVGNYENDLRNGQGTYYFANGDKYEGSFKNSQIHGEGTYTWATGRVHSGTFENGQIVE